MYPFNIGSATAYCNWSVATLYWGFSLYNVCNFSEFVASSVVGKYPVDELNWTILSVCVIHSINSALASFSLSVPPSSITRLAPPVGVAYFWFFGKNAVDISNLPSVCCISPAKSAVDVNIIPTLPFTKSCFATSQAL